MNNSKILLVSILGALGLAATACESDPSAGAKLGEDVVTGQPVPLPTPTPEPTPTSPPPPPASTAELGASCSSSEGASSHYCLALKYVVYENPTGASVVSSDQAIAN